jgi:hypothetical protein
LYASTPWHSSVYTLTRLHVGSGTTVTLFPAITDNGVYTDDYGVELRVADLTVENGGAISADELGYGESDGPGQGGTAGRGASGAGHGGWGGAGSSGDQSGGPYGQAQQPQMPGSGGGTYGTAYGGAGGGAFKLVVSDTLLVSGTLTAGGAPGTKAKYDGGGGGSGGSLWIDAGTFRGSGTVQADGGDGAQTAAGKGGGGAGGRVAIYASSNTFTATGGTYSVAGGGGYEAGDAGTLYVYQAGSPVTLTAGFTGTPTSGVAPLTVYLTDTATPAGAADQWYWTLGDGGSSTAQHPVYTYTQVGVYTVTQRVTDTATSQWDALTRTNYITVTDVPVAGLSATNDSPTALGQAIIPKVNR